MKGFLLLAVGFAFGGLSQDKLARDADFAFRRAQMVKTQLEARSIRDDNVLNAMREVPRHTFIPEAVRHLSYEDRALPFEIVTGRRA